MSLTLQSNPIAYDRHYLEGIGPNEVRTIVGLHIKSNLKKTQLKDKTEV